MQPFRSALAIFLVSTLVCQVVFAASITSRDGQEEYLVATDNVGAMMQGVPLVSQNLSRRRRSFAHLHMGRDHYYGNSRARRRRLEHRYEALRRHRRLHYQGAGQIVYE